MYPFSDQTEVGEWGGVSLQRHGWDLPVLSSVLRWSGSEELLSLWLQVMDVACRWLELYINSQLCHCIKCSASCTIKIQGWSLSGCGPMFYVYSSVLVNSVCNSGSGAERPLSVHSQSSRTTGQIPNQALLTCASLSYICARCHSVSYIVFLLWRDNFCLNQLGQPARRKMHTKCMLLFI